MADPSAPPGPPTPAASWAALLDASTDALALLDAEGRIVWANAGFFQLTRYPAAQAIGATLADLLAPPAGWPQWVRLLQHGEPLQDEPLTWRDSDGHQRPGLVTARRLEPSETLASAALLLRLRNITDLQDEVRSASDLAERLQAAVNAAGIGVWSRHPKNIRADWNEQMFRITGRPPHLGGPTREEWINEIVHPDDRDAIRAARAAISADTMSADHSNRIVRPDGEVRWVDTVCAVRSATA